MEYLQPVGVSKPFPGLGFWLTVYCQFVLIKKILFESSALPVLITHLFIESSAFGLYMLCRHTNFIQ